jgi:hypothetical protein
MLKNTPNRAIYVVKMVLLPPMLKNQIIKMPGVVLIILPTNPRFHAININVHSNNHGKAFGLLRFIDFKFISLAPENISY